MNEPAMSRAIDGVAVEIPQADATACDRDDIVNAARSALAGGGRAGSAQGSARGEVCGSLCRCIGLPAVPSRGPADRAARIAVRTLRKRAEHSGAASIVLCCLGAASALLHSEMLRIETAPSSP